MMKQTNFFSIAVLMSVLACGGGLADAQMPQDAMGLPIPTTIVLTKPAPGKGFEGRLLITVGVGKSTYKFILQDAYTNHTYVLWPSIWEQARQSTPNLYAEGIDSEQFARVKPGATVTISGMYTSAQRCFEVLSVDDGDHRYDGGDEMSHY